MTAVHKDNETYLDHGNPGDPDHWRVLYIKWLGGPPDRAPDAGVTAEDVIRAVREALEQEGPQTARAREYLDRAIASLSPEGEASLEYDPPPETPLDVQEQEYEAVLPPPDPVPHPLD